MGGDSIKTTAAGLPNLTGYFSSRMLRDDSTVVDDKLFTKSIYSTGRGQDNYNQGLTITFNASRANAIYGNSDTVQPPSFLLLPQIKY